MLQGKLNVFRASAGSGKTFELTAQYISLLLSHEKALPRTILAVTFTNKATGEMKQRILEHLYDIAHAAPTDEPDDFLAKVMRETRQTAAVLRQRAANALHTILHTYDDFHVQTIDSFLQRLLRALAHELGLAASYQVDIEDKETINNAIDRLMEELPNHKQLMEWMTRFALQRLDDEQKWDVVLKVRKLAEQINKENFAKDSTLLANKLNNTSMRNYQSMLHQTQEQALQDLRAEAEALQPLIGDGKRFKNGRNIAGYINSILHGKHLEEIKSKTVENYLADIENWLSKANQSNATLIDEAKTLQPRLAALDEKLKASIHLINSCKLSLKNLGELRLLGEIDKLVTELCNETGRFLLGRTPLLFDRLVGQSDTSFVYERAGVQFHHVMIDEFQDTSTLQWHTFHHLINESLAAHHSSMLVGDVKQSIYRWRNGDWETLSGIERFFNAEQLAITTLQTNFRSDRRIVEFNNAFFQHALSHPLFSEQNTQEQQAELRRIYSDVVQQVAPGKGEGFVRVSVSDDDGKLKDITAPEPTAQPFYNTEDAGEEEQASLSILEDVARQITTLHHDHGLPFRDMAILVRTKTEAQLLMNHMVIAHPELPFISADAFRLSASPAVQTVIATLRYMRHSADTAALTYLLRTYYHDILAQDIAWEELLSRRDELLPPALRKEWSHLRRMPLYEKCEQIIALLKLGQIEGQQEYLFTFLDSVKAFLQSERSDIKQFLKHWDEKLCSETIAAANTEGIALVTIHSSKGLAYHTVLMPFLKWKVCEHSSLWKQNILWCKPNQKPYSQMPLLPIECSKTMNNSVYNEAYQCEMFRQRVENLNLLYVAFTRAVHNLLLWVDLKKEKNKDNNSIVGQLVASYVVPSDEPTPFVMSIGTPVGTTNTDKAGRASPNNPLRTIPELQHIALPTATWRAEFRQSTQATEFHEQNNEQQRQNEYINQGKLYHYIFQHIANADDVPTAVRRAVEEGLLPKEQEAQTRTFITKRITTGQAAQWFNDTWTLLREATILHRAADGTLQRRRPDRVMMQQGHTIVIDYKFGNKKATHIEQLEAYAQMLRQMGHQNVKAYVWYVFQNEIIEHKVNNL